MHPTRIAELLEPFLSRTPNACHSESGRRPGEEPAALSPAQLGSISTYINILLRWNARINLTAIRNEKEIVTRHFGESLFVARHLFPNHIHVEADAFVRQPDQSSPIRLADLGSGAGFPGLPIKLWAPEISLTLIESNQKKATFLREVVRALSLTEVKIQNTRAEDLPQHQPFDVVTLRAVEGFTAALRTAVTLLASAGCLALLIGSSQLDQARSTLPEISWSSPLLIPKSQSRMLLLGSRRI
ncbi:MAG: 16S rRNA (guanine(527)-N(7))-methyltransferase RsmG [Candidatus Sulfotelmatobacter sp.]